MKTKEAMAPTCNICKRPLRLISGYVMCADCYKKETERTTLKPEKIVFILDGGFSEKAVLKSNELRRLVVKGFGYAEFPSGGKAAVYTKDENKLWKFTD